MLKKKPHLVTFSEYFSQLSTVYIEQSVYFFFILQAQLYHWSSNKNLSMGSNVLSGKKLLGATYLHIPKKWGYPENLLQNKN